MTERTAAVSNQPIPAGALRADAHDEPDMTADTSTRVLVADDNPTVRKILRHMLTLSGWESIEAEDGEQALKLARGRPGPQAILVDFHLPKLNGEQICRSLKQDERYQRIPIVAMTSVDSPEEKLRALEAGADDFLRKPINRAELTARLRSLLRMHRFNQELIGAESVALALARAVAAKDGYSHSHTEHVASLAVTIGKAMGMDAGELKILRYGAILHNVGKIGIPDAVLEKTGPLTPREMAMFQQHPRIGCDICAPLKPLAPVLSIIRHHKERWDGSGYPDRLRGDEIPLGAQIVGIVNVYAALISNRPYRKAITHSEAIARLREQAEQGWHNPDLVERFITCLEATGAAEQIVTSPDPEAIADDAGSRPQLASAAM